MMLKACAALAALACVLLVSASAAHAHTVALSWTASTSPGVTYNVYRGLQSGGPYTQIASGVSSTAYTDTAVTTGTVYFYVVTAFDGTNESIYSNEAMANVTGHVWAPIASLTWAVPSGWVSRLSLVWVDISSLLWE